eukprot:1776111-Prymnesium_polylepis.2
MAGRCAELHTQHGGPKHRVYEQGRPRARCVHLQQDELRPKGRPVGMNEAHSATIISICPTVSFDTEMLVT